MAVEEKTPLVKLILKRELTQFKRLRKFCKLAVAWHIIYAVNLFLKS